MAGWGGKRAGAGRKIGNMARLAPLLVRTLQALPRETAIELLERPQQNPAGFGWVPTPTAGCTER